MKKHLTPKNMNKFIIIATMSALCVCTGCKNASKQKTGNTDPITDLPACQDTSQNKPDVIKIDGTSYPALNKLLVLPDDAKAATIPWPVSLDKYLEYIYSNNNLTGYQPADSLLSFLETIGFDGAEYECYTLPFRNKHILPLLLWACFGDNEYYLIITIDAVRGKVIDHVEVGEVTVNDIISFRIDEDFHITQFKAENVYNEPDNTYHRVDKERLNSYQIEVDGKIAQGFDTETGVRD